MSNVIVDISRINIWLVLRFVLMGLCICKKFGVDKKRSCDISKGYDQKKSYQV